MSGGNIPRNSAVYFDIPSQFVSGATNYCLENIPIPQSVDGTDCLENDNVSCWLVIGVKAADDEQDQQSMSDYNCVCSGGSTESGMSSLLSTVAGQNSYLVDSCGLTSTNDWGTSCQDVNPATDLSNAFAEIAICPNTVKNAVNNLNNCGYCSGGQAPALKIGIEWTNNKQVDCLDDPFNANSGGDTGNDKKLSTGALIGIVVAPAVLISVVIVLCMSSCEKRNNEDNDSKATEGDADVEGNQS